MLVWTASFLSSRVSVLKHSFRKMSSMYFLLCALLSWSLILFLRGRCLTHATRSNGSMCRSKFEWIFWLKIFATMLLTCGVPFIDSLPPAVLVSFGRAGVTFAAMVVGVVFVTMKLQAAYLYTKYDPPELIADGYVVFSTYRKCCDLFFFLLLHSLQMAYCAWRYPREALFLKTSPSRQDLYAQFYTQCNQEMQLTSVIARDASFR